MSEAYLLFVFFFLSLSLSLSLFISLSILVNLLIRLSETFSCFFSLFLFCCSFSLQIYPECVQSCSSFISLVFLSSVLLFAVCSCFSVSQLFYFRVFLHVLFVVVCMICFGFSRFSFSFLTFTIYFRDSYPPSLCFFSRVTSFVPLGLQFLCSLNLFWFCSLSATLSLSLSLSLCLCLSIIFSALGGCSSSPHSVVILSCFFSFSCLAELHRHSLLIYCYF